MPSESSVVNRLAEPGLEAAVIRTLREEQAIDASALYEDPDFSPSDPSTLYVDPAKPPEYASSDEVVWYRPTEFTAEPEYFKTPSGCGIVREGVLHDAWLLGVLAAVALHPDGLIENLFACDSLGDFVRFGVYSCRFFKDDEWVTVTTDTRLPYDVELAPEDRVGSASTPGTVLYGASVDKSELFIPLLEKAYAKLHGSYESLDEGRGGGAGISSRILEAFLDCTGGSAHRIQLQQPRFQLPSGEGAAHLWRQLQRAQRRRSIVTVQIKQMSFNAFDTTGMGLLKNRQYVVQHVCEVESLRFVKLRNVWGRGMWKGDWSNDDSKWEEHAQVEHALRRDEAAQFSRAGRDGCFWMVLEDLLAEFTELFVVHVFPDDAGWRQYSVRGEWMGLTAAGSPSKFAGPPSPTRPVATVDAGESTAAAGSKKETPIENTKWAALADADPSWFRNPQFRLSVREKTGNVTLSLVQRDFRLYGGDNFAINFVLLRDARKPSAALVEAADKAGPLEPPTRAWDFKPGRVVAEARSIDPTEQPVLPPMSASGSNLSGAGQNPPGTPGAAYARPVPDRELVKEDVTLEAGALYLLVPFTTNAKVDMEFFLRVWAPKPVLVERVPPLFSSSRPGRWRHDAEESGEPSTAGGPLCLQFRSGGANPAWGQNPQFWVRLPEGDRRLDKLLAAKPHVTLRATVIKTSHRAGGGKKRDAARDRGLLVGVAAVRAESTSEAPASAGDGSNASSSMLAHRAMAKAPKTNFLGQELPKAHTAAKDEDDSGDDDVAALSVALSEQHALAEAKHSLGNPDSSTSAMFPPAKLVVAPSEWARVSEYSSPAVACLHLAKVPKAWLDKGLLLVPSLGEPGLEGSFELQVDCDVPVAVTELPTVRSLAGEWTERASGGCHLHGDWRQNPKFLLELKGVRPGRVVISLSRSELEWQAKCKRDVVGTMMGFYLFSGGAKLSREPEPGHTIIVNGRPWSETDFVPLHSVRSPPELVLPAATKEPYVIMPATYEPGRLGRFVLSVQCDTEFALSAEGD